MYYQSQVRNLAKQAELGKELVAVRLLEDKVLHEKEHNQRENKGYTPSRQKRDKEISLQLKRSRIEADLDATTVSTNAILNRSRIQAALQSRQRNQQINKQESERSLNKQRQLQARLLQEEQQLYLETQRQHQMRLLQQERIREELCRSIRLEEEERVYYQMKEDELRRQVYEEQIRRQLRHKYDPFSRLYYHY